MVHTPVAKWDPRALVSFGSNDESLRRPPRHPLLRSELQRIASASEKCEKVEELQEEVRRGRRASIIDDRDELVEKVRHEML